MVAWVTAGAGKMLWDGGLPCTLSLLVVCFKGQLVPYRCVCVCVCVCDCVSQSVGISAHTVPFLRTPSHANPAGYIAEPWEWVQDFVHTRAILCLIVPMCPLADIIREWVNFCFSGCILKALFKCSLSFFEPLHSSEIKFRLWFYYPFYLIYTNGCIQAVNQLLTLKKHCSIWREHFKT